MSDPKPLPELFTNRDTTFADIKASGWHVYLSSGGSWWFEKRDAERGSIKERVSVPQWIHELEVAAEARGADQVQHAIKRALEIK